MARRRVTGVATVVFLAILTALLGLMWACSYLRMWACDYCMWDRHVRLYSSCGKIGLVLRPKEISGALFSFLSERKMFGFRCGRSSLTYPDGITRYVYNIWVAYPWPMATSVSLVIIYVLRLRKHLYPSRTSPTCEQCEYDLTGNISGVCPECGQTIVSNNPSSANQLKEGGSAKAGGN
jgi:hypothetical protein